MEISGIGLELIKKFEGFSSKPYRCPAGKLTIGYGHAIIFSDQFPEGGITQSMAEDMLKQDVSVAENSINRLVAGQLLQRQFDALCSFVYNIGAKAFEKSSLLRLLNQGHPELAAAEFARWIYTGGIVQNGLIRRREAEKSLFLGL